MNVIWSTFIRPDGTSCPQIASQGSASWRTFDQIASVLVKGLHGRWVAKLDGLDQRYWDLEARSGSITLHYEHYIGITVYPGGRSDGSSLALLEDAYELLAHHDTE